MDGPFLSLKGWLLNTEHWQVILPGISYFLQFFAVNLMELKVNFTQSKKRGNVGCREGMALKSEEQTDLEPSSHSTKEQQH